MKFGAMEIGLVVLIVVLLFGPSRLAGLGKGIGEGIRNFKRGLRPTEPRDEVTTELPAVERSDPARG